MPTIVENKLITLNTRYAQRNNGSFISDVIFPFRGVLKEEDDIISSNICIMNAQIPVSFYTINETNNTFQMKLTASPTYTLITIPLGNYNANSLLTVINAQITGLATVVTLTPANGKLLFTAAASVDVLMTALTPSGDPNFIFRILGFPNAGYVQSGTSIVPAYPLNLLGVNRLAIRSSKLLINSFNSVTANLGITLATIPVDVPAFSLINYTNQTDLNKAALQIKIIDLIDIQIVDEDNNPINFNGIDWTMTLVLENIRHIPDQFVPRFQQLMAAQPQTIEADRRATSEAPPKEEDTNDVKELELLA